MARKTEKTIEIVLDCIKNTVDVEAKGYPNNTCSLDVNALLEELGKVMRKRMKRDNKDQTVTRVQRT